MRRSSKARSSVPRKIAVSGGSIGGLCAGIELSRVGCEVDVFERTEGRMSSRGAGIVVQPEVTTLLNNAGAPPLPTTYCTHRLYLSPDGGAGQLTVMPQRFTSWEAIYISLKAAFPAHQYHSGARVVAADPIEDGIRLSVDGMGGNNATNEMDVDLLIAAEGVHSQTRARLLPNVAADYAGYVAYRGTVVESEVPGELVRFFNERFAFCSGRSGGHILNYLIPGDEAVTTTGRRRLNWVWYVPVTTDNELSEVLTDRAGHVRKLAVPPGMLPDGAVSNLWQRAVDELHPQFAALVQSTPEPFVQSIVDIRVPQMVFGRMCLLGDAAFVVRPHTAAGSAKAAADATALADAISRTEDIDTALAQWETAQLRMGEGLTRYGVALGRRSTAT